MKQERTSLMNKGNERQKQQRQELNEREQLTQKPNVQEVGLDKDEDGELYTSENEQHRLNPERLTERSDRRL